MIFDHYKITDSVFKVGDIYTSCYCDTTTNKNLTL